MSAMTTAAPDTRRRDADATKAAILRAARTMLGRRSYGDITLKAIAERAGVSAPLIVKYFGNKEKLFARVISFETDAAALLDAPLGELGRHMVTQILTSQNERGIDPILRIVFAPLHSAEGQGDVLRANFREQVIAGLARRLTGPEAALRAELAVGMLLGLGAVYGIARGEAVRAMTVPALVERCAPALQELITPTGNPVAPAAR